MGNLQYKIVCLVFTLFYFLSSSVAPIFAINYSYDANGNMISDGSQCFEYNDANQIKRVKNCTTNQIISEYTYDSTGQRAIKKNYKNGQLDNTTYDINGSFETKITTTLQRFDTTYFFADGKLLASKNPDGKKNFYHNDHLGSINVITDETGALVEKNTYFAFGETKEGGLKSKYQFTGQEKDQETALYYYDARYYNPQLKRFIQPDSLLANPYDPQQLNRYSYVRNNPLKYTDPSGHFIWPLFASIYTYISPILPAITAELSVGMNYIIATTTNAIKNYQQNPSYTQAALSSIDVLSSLPGMNLIGPGFKATSFTSKASTISKTDEAITYSTKYLTNTPTVGWKLGDPINNLTIHNNVPTWSTVRARFWKTEALYNPTTYATPNLTRMQNGLAPRVPNSLGKIEALELNHVPPQRSGGLYEFDIVTHEEHVLIDPFRY